MDKLTSMAVFAKVAKGGSFASAAKELGISRAMASKHVMQLENSLGVRLLNRSTRRISLTEVGAAYLERCLQILADTEEAELAITRMQTEPRGLLKLTAPPFFGTFHVGPAIGEYLQRYPRMRVQLILSASDIDLIEEAMDLGIFFGELRDSSLVARKLAESRLVVCAAPAYFEKHGIPRTPDELREHNCLVNWALAPGDNWQFRHPQHGTATLKVSGNMQANVADAVRLAALQGLGVVLLPTYMVGQDLSAGRLVAALTDYEAPQRDIHVVYAHRKFLSAKVRTFVEFLCARFQPRPYWDDWMEH